MNDLPAIHGEDPDRLLALTTERFKFGDEFEVVYDKAGMITLMDYHLKSMLYKIHEPFRKAAKRNGYEVLIKEDLINRKVTYSFSRKKKQEGWTIGKDEFTPIGLPK